MLVNRIISPRKFHISVTGACERVTLNDKRNFLDELKGRTLAGIHYFELSIWTHCNPKSSWKQKRGAEGRRPENPTLLALKQGGHESRNGWDFQSRKKQDNVLLINAQKGIQPWCNNDFRPDRLVLDFRPTDNQELNCGNLLWQP